MCAKSSKLGEVDAESRQKRRQRQAAHNDDDDDDDDGMDGVILESEHGEVAEDEDDDQQAWIQDFLPDHTSFLNDGGLRTGCEARMSDR